MRFKEVDDTVESTRSIHVVRIEPTDDVSMGHGEALVNCIRLAIVQFRTPLAPGRKSSQDGECFICATAIDDEIFQVLNVLTKNTQYSSLNEASLIK
jgi:hypothetical protein